MRVLVYQNPNAGKEQRPPESLIAELQRAGHEVRWLKASEPLPQDVQSRFDLVVTAGGDGSVGRAGRQLIGTGMPIATVPLGTANNLGSELRATPDDLTERIQAWRAQPFDVGVLQGVPGATCFLEGFGAGAFAEAAAALSEVGDVSPPFGVRDELARDLRRLARTVRTSNPLALEVAMDGERAAGRYVLAEVLNISAIGPRVYLAPLADPADGWLDVVLVEAADREALAAALDACEPGAKCLPGLGTRRARQVSFAPPSGTTLHVDGKSFVADGATVVVSVHAGALTILRGAARDERILDAPPSNPLVNGLPSAPPAPMPPPPRRNPLG